MQSVLLFSVLCAKCPYYVVFFTTRVQCLICVLAAGLGTHLSASKKRGAQQEAGQVRASTRTCVLPHVMPHFTWDQAMPHFHV